VHVVPERSIVQLPPLISPTAARRARAMVLGQAQLVDFAFRRSNLLPVRALEVAVTVFVCGSRVVAVTAGGEAVAPLDSFEPVPRPWRHGWAGTEVRVRASRKEC
jgi:hypothetical protein